MSSDLRDRSLLACHNLGIERRGRGLLAGLGFSLTGGGILLLRGKNGSGKTSLIRTLCGLLPPGHGEIFWRDEPIGRSETFSGELIYLGHADGLKPEASVSENLRFWAAMSGTAALLPAVAHYLGFDRDPSIPVRLLSAGQRRRVALSRLMLAPQAKLWLLDEPANNLDDDGVGRLGGLIASKLRQGGAVIMSAHQLPDGLAPDAPTGVIDLSDFAVCGQTV